MTVHKKGRRRFLKGVGGVALALPLLEWDRSAQAYANNPPQRYVQFLHPQGTLYGQWRPSGTGTNYDLSWILSPLAAHQADLLVLSGINNPQGWMNIEAGANGHVGPCRSLLTAMPLDGNVVNGQHVHNVGMGPAAGPSIDQVLAQRIGGETPFESAELAIGGADPGENQMLHRAAGQPVGLEDNPVSVLDKYFAAVDPDDQGEALATLQRLRLHRKSVLDAVDEGIGNLQSQLGAADRAVLEAHLTALREAEMDLTGGGGGMPGAGCTQPTLDLPGDYFHDGEWHADHTSRAMIDLAVMALTCDLVRVVTLQYTRAHGPLFPWLNAPIPGTYANWHEMVHTAPVANEGLRAGFKWYMDELAYLLDALAGVEDGDCRLLDSTMVFAVSEFQDGAGHIPDDLPVVIAGGAGGVVPVGAHRDVSGRTVNDLYTTFLRWFGQDDNDFGWASNSSGPIASLLS